MKKKYIKLVKEYRLKKNLINKIKFSINNINREKEFWFNKKEGLKKEITGSILKIKEFKLKRDQNNISIENFKKQRDKHNYEVKKLIKRFKKLNAEKTYILKKYNLKIDPTKIHEKINDLERKVETEADYKKEKKLMEQIKKLKKVYDESTEIVMVTEKINSLSDEIKKSKDKANEFHRKIISSVKDKPYSDFIKITKQITILKKDQEKAFAKFIELKNKYFKHSNLLKSNTKELENLIKKLRKKKLLGHLEKQELIKEILQEKSKKVEEKIKKGKKLTTEDLLAFQAKK